MKPAFWIRRTFDEQSMVVIQPLPTLATLEMLWRTLGAHAQHSFFLSWPWIRTWLACMPHWVQPRLLTVSTGGATVAAALLVRRTLTRRGIVAARTWVLNATGDPQLDQIFIENNGLLVHENYRDWAWQAWMSTLAESPAEWEEVQLRGIPYCMVDSLKDSPFRLRDETTLSARYIDLKEIAASQRSFLARLSKKVRNRIRHTRSMLEEMGPVVVEVAGTVEEAGRYFEELKILHQSRWVKKGEPGAFGFPFFELFHSELIANHFHEGVIQLLRVRAGNATVGVLYNFIHNNEVLVYQTGFNYSLIKNKNRESPGLLTHVLAIDFNVVQGFDNYDLLAGDSEYKRALTSKSKRLWWGTVQRPKLKFRLESGAESAWRFVRDLSMISLKLVVRKGR